MTDDAALDALLMRTARSDHAPTTAACPPEAQLEAHAFERLAGAEADAVQHHLTTCPDCRAYWVGLRVPVAAAVLDRMAAAAPRPVRWTLWAGLGVLAAAAAVILLIFPGVSAPPPYALDGPWGGVKAMRDDTAPASQVFLPHSRLGVSLKPQTPLKGAPPVASLYVARAGGPLEARPSSLLQPGEGGVFVLEAAAGELFGTTPGVYTLHLVLDTAPPPDRAGQAPAAARAAAEGATWLEVPVDYRLEAP